MMPGETITGYNWSQFAFNASHIARVDAEVDNVIAALKQQASHNNIVALTSGIPLTENTITSYKKHYDCLKYFFGQIHDFNSLLILDTEPLKYYPSMNPASIVLHYK